MLLRRLGRPSAMSATPTPPNYLKCEVSDGIIAPGYTDEALEILQDQEKGQLQRGADRPRLRSRRAWSTRMFSASPSSRAATTIKIDEELLANIVTENKDLPDQARKIDMMVALITLKYTQSNSVCYVKDGQAIGVGAGQQSRIHCTRLAGNKADNWYLRQHPKVLGLPVRGGHPPPRPGQRHRRLHLRRVRGRSGGRRVAAGLHRQARGARPRRKSELDCRPRPASPAARDAFFPFGDNIERAHKMRRVIHRRARRLHPGRPCHRDRRQATAWSWPLPACACSTTDTKESAAMKLMVVGGGGREHAIIKEAERKPRSRPRFTPCPATAASPPTHVAWPLGPRISPPLWPLPVRNGHRLRRGGPRRPAGAGGGGRSGGQGDRLLRPPLSRGREHRGQQGLCQRPDEEIRHPHRRL